MKLVPARTKQITLNYEGNSCDHGHNGHFQTRLLPYGGGGNIIVCWVHYQKEMLFRRERNTQLGEGCKFDLPKWNELEVYADI